MRTSERQPDIDSYLAKLPRDQRDVLERLRKIIHATAKGAEECISYGMPAFRLDGRVLMYFGASSKHLSFFPGSGTAVAAYEKELEGYSTSKGTIRFEPSNALPESLVRKIVRYRIKENAAEGSAAPARTKRRK